MTIEATVADEHAIRSLVNRYADAASRRDPHAVVLDVALSDRATGRWFVQEVGQRAEGANLTIAGIYHDEKGATPACGSSCAVGTTRCCEASTAP